MKTAAADVTQKGTARPGHALERHTWGNWFWAVIGALGLNAALFVFMPFLQHPDQKRPDLDQLVSYINVVRVKRPESPIKKKSDPPPEPPKPVERLKPQALAPQTTALTLPFAVNPRLPAAPGSLVLPELDPAPVDIGGIENAFAAGELDAPLMVLTRMPPEYPVKAKYRGIEGWVRVRFIVQENGRVGNITILEADPPGLFDQSVIRCVGGWRFKPGTIEGMPVKAWAETTVRFELE